ncbi:putative alpha beta hydrolase protein [Aspergillus bombycis]|uniref:Putative alpha beta hydrolase protein n=1 Tax=Aspergillus bombycis TaxID=109264 RepID=A0A1F8AD83_9EURO|nr:putative alpha beta hydrolase protein [Aspergillus bombycis]OGM49369.1 putative alpha beta hydrolase protein [Aspergillus bombycis]
MNIIPSVRCVSVSNCSFVSAGPRHTTQFVNHGVRLWRLPTARCHSSAASIPSEKHINRCEGESLTLADGRTLGFHLYGAPDGIPVFYLHGVVDTGVTLQGKEDSLAKELGIRWIAADRPGVGKSTFQAGRSIMGYPDDIRQLVNHLGLERYYLFGVSGGSAYTLACAKMLPREQVRGVGICAGVAPWHAGRRGQTLKIISQMYLMKYWPQRLLRNTRDIYVPLARDPDQTAMANRFRRDLLPYMDATQADAYMDTDAMQSAVRVYRQYYAQGIDAHVADMRILTRPWGFRIEDVAYEGVKLWYGGADVNTPPHMGLHLARRLPKSVYKEYAGEDHGSLLAGGHLRGILSDLLVGSV